VRDQAVVDYDLWRMEGVDESLRGPRPTLRGGFVTCVGAAQTFGTLVRRPYSAALEEMRGGPVLNLGIAGAGPGIFLEQFRPLIEIASRGDAAVLQVLSARSVSNRLFDSKGGANGLRLSDGKFAPMSHHYRDLLEVASHSEVEELVAETRQSWVRLMLELIEVIQVPVVLLWFGKRPPDYEMGFENFAKLFGGAPQLVNREMVTEVASAAARYVECVTSEGMPHTFVSRFDGGPVSIEGQDGTPLSSTAYYPSPDMHRIAAAMLWEEAGDLLGG